MVIDMDVVFRDNRGGRGEILGLASDSSVLPVGAAHFLESHF